MYSNQKESLGGVPTTALMYSAPPQQLIRLEICLLIYPLMNRASRSIKSMVSQPRKHNYRNFYVPNFTRPCEHAEM